MRVVTSSILMFVTLASISLLTAGEMVRIYYKAKTMDRKEIAEEYPEVPILFMDPERYDAAIIGITAMCQGTSNHNVAVYDIDKVIEINMEDGMSYEEAAEHFDFNQADGYHGKYTPIFVKVKEK